MEPLDNQIARDRLLLFSGAVFAISGAGTWLHARSAGPLPPEVAKDQRELRGPATLAAVFGGSLLLLPVSTDYVRYSWLLLIPVMRWSLRRPSGRESRGSHGERSRG